MQRLQLQHVILAIGRRFDLRDLDIEHGYFAQGVSLGTPAFATANWQGRAFPVRVAEHTGWCMEPRDFVLKKLGAGRDEDLEFASDATTLSLVRRDELLARLETVRCTDDHRTQITARVHVLFS